ncbi:hypothetical protein [Streptomyces virginiae]|uniref:hypothetical protein n=1 Tax=Streptomyces virginiae TaxID=1961 RepID=UPI002255C8C4|nr:hypothetical protein [Streptomyces virginiae]MCX4714471.1 hypothetical protein [Streptomyces virginiae]MCX5272188.1 hypothetical protein [Streptomyces virginiae]
MAFEVLPGTGLALPRGADVLRFGSSEREARWAVATLADVRGTWVCGTGWAFTARYEGLELLAYGDCPDRLDRTGHDRHGLAAVHLGRHEAEPTGPSAVPVVLRGVDLFGYPAAEVLEALGPGPHPGVTLPRPGSLPAPYLPEVRLAAL